MKKNLAALGKRVLALALLALAIACLAGCGGSTPKEKTGEAAVLLGPEGEWTAVGIKEHGQEIQPLPESIRCTLLLVPGARGMYSVVIAPGSDNSGRTGEWEAGWTWADGRGEITVCGPIRLACEMQEDKLLLWDGDGSALVLARSSAGLDMPEPSVEKPEGEWVFTGIVRSMGTISPKYAEQLDITLLFAQEGKCILTENSEGDVDRSGTYDMPWTWYENRGTVTLLDTVFSAEIRSGRLVIWDESGEEILVFTRKGQ